MRQFTNAKAKYDAKDLLAVTFKSMKRVICKSLRLRACEIKQRARLSTFTKKTLLKDWKEMAKKHKALRECQQVSIKIDRYRVLSKFLGLWLRKLSLKLKKQHMNEAKEKFYARSTKRKVIRAWSRAYEYHINLKLKDQQITSAQERHLMVKVLQALQEHKRVSQIKNAKVATANQEYTYWLGKRVISCLRCYRDGRLAEREVIQQFVDQSNRKLKQRILLAIRVYSDYIKDRKAADSEIVSKVEASRKQRFLKVWAHCYSKRVGLKLLASSLQNSQTRISFDQIRHVLLHQDATIEYFRSTYPTRLMGNSLKAWRRFKQ